MGSDVIYDIEHVTKKFPGVVALDDITLKIQRGEIFAIVGENGAGKSTLMNILSGAYDKTEGKLVFDGQPITKMDSIQAKNMGIAMVHQELSLSHLLSIAENIFQGAMPKKKNGFINFKKLYADSRALLKEVGLERMDPRTLVKDINVSQQQQVEIAKALSRNPKLLILDEPTSSLTPREADILLDIMRGLKEKGITMLYISHKLDEVLRISDRLAVFRDGKLIDVLETKKTKMDDMISLMVGRKYAGGFRRSSYMEDYTNAEPVLEVEGLNIGNKVHDVSFKLYKGELLGLAGLVGAGRSEVLQAVFGADKRESGVIRIHGKEVPMKSTREAIEHKMGLIPEGRKTQSLFLKFNVKENISIVYMKDTLNKLGLKDGKKEKAIADRFVEELKIKTPSVEQKIVNLSGGNQQKAVIARWLVEAPDILFLDEPTQGIDIGSKNEIYEIIDRLVQAGTSVIMVSSEMQENLILCDRVITMYEGRITGRLHHSELSEESMMSYMAKSSNLEKE